MQKFYKALGISFLLALMLGVSACNTVAGIGTDIREGGDAIRRAVN